MKALRVISILSCGLFLTGCGQRDKSDASLTSIFSTPAIRPLIVGMSGYSTCTQSRDYHNGEWGPLGARMFRNIEVVASQITSKLNVEPAILASCFTSERQLITASSLDNWALSQPRDDEYLSALQRKVEDFTHVFVVGHSYGGWLAIKLVETYHGDAEKFKTLYSIDPISKKLCYFDNVSECLSAPRDINKEAREHIRDYTGIWVNPWQDATFFLHSSSISEADENPKYNLDHWDIDNDPDLWDDFSQKVTLSL